MLLPQYSSIRIVRRSCLGRTRLWSLLTQSRRTHLSAGSRRIVCQLSDVQQPPQPPSTRRTQPQTRHPRQREQQPPAQPQRTRPRPQSDPPSRQSSAVQQPVHAQASRQTQSQSWLSQSQQTQSQSQPRQPQLIGSDQAHQRHRTARLPFDRTLPYRLNVLIAQQGSCEQLRELYLQYDADLDVRHLNAMLSRLAKLSVASHADIKAGSAAPTATNRQAAGAGSVAGAAGSTAAPAGSTGLQPSSCRQHVHALAIQLTDAALERQAPPMAPRQITNIMWALGVLFALWAADSNTYRAAGAVLSASRGDQPGALYCPLPSADVVPPPHAAQRSATAFGSSNGPRVVTASSAAAGWLDVAERVETLLARFLPLAGDATAQEVALVLYAVVQVGCQPQPAQLTALLNLTHARLTGSGRVGDGEVGRVGGAGHGSRGASAQQAAGGANAQRTGGGANAQRIAKPQDFSLCLYSLARLQSRPGAAWLREVTAASQTSLQHFSAQALANMLWALAYMKAPPLHRLWTSHFLRAAGERFDAFYNHELCTIAWAVTELRMKPSTAWLTAFTRQLQQRSPTLAAQDVTAALQALGRLSKQHTDNSTAGVLVPILAQLSSNSLVPRPVHSERGRQDAQPPAPTPRALFSALGALPGAAVAPSAAYAAAAQVAVGRRLESCTAVELVAAATAVGALRWRPPRRWSARFCRCALAALPAASVGDLTGLLLGVARMRLRPDRQWFEAVLLEVEGRYAQLGVQELACCLMALAQIGFRPGRRWLRGYLAAAHAAMTSQTARCSSRESSTLLRAAAHLGCRPQQRWVSDARAALAKGQLAGCSVRELQGALSGLAKLAKLQAVQPGKAGQPGSSTQTSTTSASHRLLTSGEGASGPGGGGLRAEGHKSMFAAASAVRAVQMIQVEQAVQAVQVLRPVWPGDANLHKRAQSRMAAQRGKRRSRSGAQPSGQSPIMMIGSTEDEATLVEVYSVASLLLLSVPASGGASAVTDFRQQ